MPRGKPSLVSFADGSDVWRATGRRLERQALESGMFSSVRVFNSGVGVKEAGVFREDAEKATSPEKKGFGYWRWKPQIVLESLKRLEGDSPGIWYIDAGSSIYCNSTAKKRMEEYVDKGHGNGWGLGFQLTSEFSDAAYTKKSVHEEYNLSLELAQTGQVQATAVFFANRPRGLELAEEWFNASLRADLFDDSRNVPREDILAEQFIGHGHDQSVLSCLLKTSGSEVVPDELGIPRSYLLSMNQDEIPFPIQGTRHKSRFNTLSMNPLVRAVRMIEGFIP